MAQANPLSGIEATLGPEMLEKIQTSKILLVGAGGIGCELLKNLALSGFRHVETIDLDTIDVSNLNRQFLFRSHHVGKSKSVVATQVAKDMVPCSPQDATYLAHHGNVCDNSKFNVQYVANFNLVLNALDNVTARRRVNRLCLAAGVPLVEAGTTGYLGQVKVIDKASNVACYECVTQETQKVYPICTIRSTPSMPVHCIVWAKELYKLLFGEKVEDSMLYEDTTAEDAEPSTYMESVVQYRSLLQDNQPPKERYPVVRETISHLFVDEINKQLGIGRYKTAKKTPTPLSTDDIATGTGHHADNNNDENSNMVPPTKRPGYSYTDVWSAVDCISELASCLEQADPSTVLPQFDKDDGLAMRIVTAASNLRSYVFGIEPIQSLYSAKGIAGNIIPAIATTNAICAGLQLLQVFGILQAQLSNQPGALHETCRYMSVTRHKVGRSQFYISSSKLDPPNPKCFVCRNATIPLTLNVSKWTLENLLLRIIKKELGFEEPTILLEGDVIHEEGEGADLESFKGNLDKPLDKLPCGGMQHGTVFRVEDFSQDLEVDVCVHHKQVWESEEGGDEEQSDSDLYLVGGDKPQVKAAVEDPTSNGVAKKAEPDRSGQVEDEDDDDEVEVIEMNPDAKMPAVDSKPAAALKRMMNGHGASSDEGGPRKKRRTEENGDHEVIVID